MNKIDRRAFFGIGTAAALAAMPSARSLRGAESKLLPVRLGVIGVGRRGMGLVKTALNVPGLEVTAVCDVRKEQAVKAQELVVSRGRPEPASYTDGEEAFRALVERDDVDAVIAATPWEWHVPMMVAAMKAGKYAATEVPAATTIEGCWELVRTSESTGMPCMMLENACYLRDVMAVLNVTRQGMLGDLVHADASYQHDLRGAMFNPNRGLEWRLEYAARHDGNHYPTHAIGPVAHWMNIDRGDRFEYLVSMSSNSTGLEDYARRTLPETDPRRRRDYMLGDVNVTLIRTVSGKSVTLYHDASVPRPKDMSFRLQGTRGIYSSSASKIYIEGRSPLDDGVAAWEDAAPVLDAAKHALWKTHGAAAKADGSHLGADFMQLLDFADAVRHRKPVPIDVYDAATWSAIVPLTEQSVKERSRAVDFPDFTSGRWKTRKPVFGV